MGTRFHHKSTGATRPEAVQVSSTLAPVLNVCLAPAAGHLSHRFHVCFRWFSLVFGRFLVCFLVVLACFWQVSYALEVLKVGS